MKIDGTSDKLTLEQTYKSESVSHANDDENLMNLAFREVISFSPQPSSKLYNWIFKYVERSQLHNVLIAIAIWKLSKNTTSTILFIGIQFSVNRK